MSTQKNITIRLTNDVYNARKKYHPYVCRRREQHIMLTVKKQQQRVAHPDTAELTRQVIIQLAPQMKRRASAYAPSSLSIETAPQQQPVRAQPTTCKATRASRTPLLILAGFLCGLVLIVLGITIMNWVEGMLTHWHEGDSYVTTLDSNVGHGGISHFLAFYRDGSVIVIEFHQDYSGGRTYTEKTNGLGADQPHSVQLDTQLMDGKRDLVFHLDNNHSVGYLLYNTGNAFSATQHP